MTKLIAFSVARRLLLSRTLDDQKGGTQNWAIRSFLAEILVLCAALSSRESGVESVAATRLSARH